MGEGMELTEVVAYLDALMQPQRYDEGEPSNGLLLDAGRPVMRIAAAVNTSFASIEGAADAGAELLLVHHTTWASIDLRLKEAKEASLREAGVSLYAAHAALDCHPEVGTSSSLARLLDVEVEGRFYGFQDKFGGVHGHVDGPFKTFVERMRGALGTPVSAWRNSDDFGRVGIVTGGAGWTSDVEAARELGCDTYVTGEGSMYTQLYAREAGINLILGTHYGTEAPGVRAWGERAAADLGLPWEFIAEDPEIH